MNTVRSVLIWSAVAMLIVAWLPAVAVVRLFDRDPARYATGRVFRSLGAVFTRLNPFWQFRFEGKYPERPRNPYVVVANHQSLADIPILSRLPWEMKWVAKAELFRIPVVGWMMSLAGDVPVGRGDARSRVAALHRARRVLDRECSVIFFPEGTRSPDGRVRAFQHGAFRLAIDAGVPILPIAIDGTGKAIPKHGWRFRDEIRARVAVLDPIPTDGFTKHDAARLAEDVRREIMARIASWRATPVDEVDAATQTPEAAT